MTLKKPICNHKEAQISRNNSEIENLGNTGYLEFDELKYLATNKQ